MKIIKWLDENFEEVVLVFLLCVMMLVMGIQVTARYLFGSSLSWSEEITRFCFIWTGFISASYCIKKGLSVKIEQIVNLPPKKITHLVKLLSYTIEIIFFAYLIPFSYHYVMAAVTNQQVSPALGMPMYVVQVATIFSFSLCVLRLVQKWILRVQLLMGKK